MHQMNWVNKAASRVHLRDTNVEEGGAGFGNYTQLSWFNKFWSLLHTMYRALTLPLVSISSCVLVRGSWDIVDWIWNNHWGSMNSYFISSLFLPLYHLPLSHLLYRGAIRGEGNTGESWCRPQPHSGCGSHRRGDGKRMHFHPTHGFGLWPHCSSGIKTCYSIPTMLHISTSDSSSSFTGNARCVFPDYI